MDELETLLAEEKETPAPALEAPEKEEVKETKSPEELKKEEHLANINKAIAEANEQLRLKRKQVKNPTLEEEEELPKIDMNDPSAKAWDRRIKDSVTPLNAENEKEKDEVRNYALSQFLSDKPALAKNGEMLKKVMETYNILKEGKISEKTVEGVLTMLDKAYVAENHETILGQQRRERIARAQADAIFSDPAVSRGATAYSSERESSPVYNEEAKTILAKWGMTPQEHAELIKKQRKSAQ